jgi:hypothetical protein
VSDHAAKYWDAAQPDPRKPGRPPRASQSATGHIHIRTTLARKAAYVRAAQGKPLAEWMTEHCDAAAAYAPDKAR